jgi:hypothetical protein
MLHERAIGRPSGVAPCARIGNDRPAHHVVLSLDVTGGFLAGAQMEFADGLNCLIGGRGAGKILPLSFFASVLDSCQTQRRINSGIGLSTL